MSSPSRIRVVADASIPYLQQMMPDCVEARYLPSDCITPEQVRDADALMVRSVTRCHETLLRGSSVQLITTATAGVDHIDADYCQAADIRWFNAPGCNAGGVVQYVLTALLDWCTRTRRSLSNLTVGIVGVGQVGGRLAKVLNAMGVRTLLNDPPRQGSEGGDEWVDLEHLLAHGDVITLHTPLTKDGQYPSYHLINREQLSAMAVRQPLFINASRGAVVDNQSLVEAIHSGWVSEAIVDCWEGEPHINRDLLGDVRYATPHIAGFSAEGKANGAVMSLDRVVQHFDIAPSLVRPIELAVPDEPLITLSAETLEQALSQALWHTLDLSMLTNLLRAEPNRFEQQRVEYFHRREMSAYTVEQVPSEWRSAFSAAGFALNCS